MDRTIPEPSHDIRAVEEDHELVPHELVAAARMFAAASKAPRTRAAYKAAWDAFVDWCDSQGLRPLPATPRAVSAFLVDRAREGRRVSTIELSLAAISQAHKLAGCPSPRSTPEVREVMRGIRRTIGVAPDQKAPIRVEELRRMVAGFPEGLQGARDRAMLLLGFAGGFRRSELVSLDVSDAAFVEDDLVVQLRRSKTDQEAEGRRIGIPTGQSSRTCPVKAVRAWMDAAGIAEGPLFRPVLGRRVGPARLSGKAVARLVKRAAHAVGLDPRQFSGHSLRAGLATAAALAGKSERSIMRQTGHRSVGMVRRYIREAELFRDNAAAGLL